MFSFKSLTYVPGKPSGTLLRCSTYSSSVASGQYDIGKTVFNNTIYSTPHISLVTRIANTLVEWTF